MNKKAEITFAEVLQLFRLKDEYRWVWLRAWIWWRLVTPLLYAVGLVSLVFSIGVALGKGVSTGWNLQPPTLILRLEATE